MVLQAALPDDLWEVNEIVNVGGASPPANLWDVDTIVEVAVGDKVWTINSALVDGGLWDVPFVTNSGLPFEEAAAQDPAFWEGLVMEDLERNAALWQDASALVASVDKGKRKMGEVPADLWGSSSNPPALRPHVPVAQRTIPVVPSGVSEADAVQKQLERIPAAVSIWGLISSSKEKLSLALAFLKVPTDLTPEAMITLILPLLSKHFVTFTKRNLPIERTAHNRPLHVIVKCRGHWVPTVLIDNGSTINICPMRVTYCLGLTKDFEPSNLAVKAYDSTRCVVKGTLMLKLNAEGFEMDVEFHVVDIPATFNLLFGRP
ncbi:hypothetical protein RHMOL_Rhmol03G0128800 [Rhododendron molle]|uniref:Uncharacterized protein n=1 Tax=Rhododendron molle TaxID=49168 RepID=A0ACC0PDB3_RHOML|nr:hypothetical protein RHMOL_Rhmol03G0128800 [Rhododendron molle]